MLGNEHGERKLSFTRWDFCISTLKCLFIFNIRSSVNTIKYKTMKTTILMLMLAFVVLAVAPKVEAKGRTGSHRIGGYTSHGKGSHYIGGYSR